MGPLGSTPRRPAPYPPVVAVTDSAEPVGSALVTDSGGERPSTGVGPMSSASCFPSAPRHSSWMAKNIPLGVHYKITSLLVVTAQTCFLIVIHLPRDKPIRT